MSFIDPRPQGTPSHAGARPTLVLSDQSDLQIPLHEALALTGGGVRAQIALSGQVYTLRITRAGGLILTK